MSSYCRHVEKPRALAIAHKTWRKPNNDFHYDEPNYLSSIIYDNAYNAWNTPSTYNKHSVHNSFRFLTDKWSQEKVSFLVMRAINWIALLAAVLATSIYIADADAPVKASTTMDTQQVKDNTKEETTAVQNLEKEIGTLTEIVEELKTDVLKEKKAHKKAKIELKVVTGELNEVRERLVARDEEVTKLRETLSTEQAHYTAELDAALQKLADETNKAQQLERTYELMEKKNKAMGQELGVAKTAELTMMALLSSYFDDARVMTEQTLGFAQDKLSEHADTLEQVQSKFDNVKKVTRDTTSKFYQENVAPTLNPILDPILADVHKVVNPQMEKFVPILQKVAVKAKKQTLVYSREALRHAKRARIEAITILEQNKHVAAYAQKVVDSVLVILAVPLALYWTRLVCRLVWWLFTTTVCVLTCGLCCGSRKRSSTTKSELAKKTASVDAGPDAPLNGSSKKAATNGLNAQKRNKKSKN
uniref:Uncharacterized protein n=1 Tax=Hyaloperonospora arabidopsidis (strain Emoy2) TaxID=559515 RepID=M4C078_HYAAE